MKKKDIFIISGLFIAIIVGSIAYQKLSGNYQSKILNSNDKGIIEDNNTSDSEDDINDNYVTESVESIMVKDIKSIDDISDDMIRQRTVGYNTVGYSSDYSDSSFKISVGTFSGCDFSKIIHTEKETKVTIKYTTTMEDDSLKVALLVEDQVITIPLDQNEFTYTLPKGDTILAISGYKASGKIEMTLDTTDDVKFMQNTES